MKKKKFLFAAGFAAVYLLLVLLLSLVERDAPEASIRSFPLALWFSLTTLTTVGYGDLYPVTAVGRVIAAVFQFLSIGVLAMLIGAIAALIRAKLLPLLRLRLSRRKDWYVFPTENEAALALANALHAENRDAVILFCGEGESPLPFAVRLHTDPRRPGEAQKERAGPFGLLHGRARRGKRAPRPRPRGRGLRGLLHERL